MFKYVQKGLTILGLLTSLLAQADLSGVKSLDLFNSTNIARSDVTMTSPTTFPANICNPLSTSSGMYTLRNNTPVPVLIQSINIINRDAFADSFTTITPTVNNCVANTFLASGATCNVLVSLTSPTTPGTFNRVLQVYFDTRQVVVESTPITSVASFSFPFTILAGSTVANTGATTITGNLGVSPGSAVIGFPPGVVFGSIHAGDAAAAEGQVAATTEYNTLAGLPCSTPLTGDIGGGTFTPGVYCFASGAGITGTVTLDGQGDPNAEFVFQISSTLTTASASNVNLINGVNAANVFWQVGSSVTLGTGSHFEGNIFALTSITANTGATLTGRAIARNGAVILDTNTVAPTCLAIE